MQRRVSAIAVLPLLVWTLVWPVETARAVGVYEDAAGLTGFLLSDGARHVQSRLILTDNEGTEASIYLISAGFPIRDNLLLDVEQSYVSASLGGSDIETGFGDLRFRARQRLWSRTGSQLSLLLGLGTGSGTRRVFPYSSQSLEMEVSVAFVDTADAVHWWALAGGTVVKREPKISNEDTRHTDFGRFMGGLVVPYGDRLRLRLGASVLVFDTGGFRDIYFAELGYNHSHFIRVHAAAHMEAASEARRVSDTAATAGITVYF